MANIVSSVIAAPPANIKIDVDFYDDDERKALQSSPLSNIFNNLPRQISIPSEDFCTFYLYYKLRPGIPGFTNHTQVAQKWHQALHELDGQVGFGRQSVYALSLQANSTGTTERLGEAIGLSVASELHGLHQADWARIKISNTKTADFRRNVASDSVHIVEVENKGSIAAEIALKSSSISAHKGSIKDKKAELRKSGGSKTVMYGTIAVLDDQEDSVARCWLVDPPASSLENPFQFKILARLEYITELISLLGQRSLLAASLRTRLSALQSLRDIMPLDRVALLRGSGAKYSEETYTSSGAHNPWFASKTVVSDGPAGGQIDMVRPDLMFFIGIREELVLYAARQDFTQLEKYRFPAGSLTKRLECVIPAGRFRSEFSPFLNIPDQDMKKQQGYITFNLLAKLHYTQSGLIFGTLDVPKTWRK